MRLTVDLPWFTYGRRLAVGMTLLSLLLAVTLPASAAPPTRSPAEVTVVNDDTNPIPVTVENEVAVTGGNNAPVNVAGEVTVGNVGPIAITGDVGATVQGAVDVNGQTFDTDGNLKVAVSSGPRATEYRNIVLPISVGSSVLEYPTPPHVTALFMSVDPGDVLLIQVGASSTERMSVRLFGGPHGQSFSETFAIPLEGGYLRLACLDPGLDAVCSVTGGHAGY